MQQSTLSWNYMIFNNLGWSRHTTEFLLSKKSHWRWPEDWLEHVCEDNTRHTFNQWMEYGIRIQEMKQRWNKFIEKKWAPMINDIKWRT
jgi:hypothetical protein